MSDSGPLIVQSDHTLMLEVAHPEYIECRDFLASFTELVKSPEFIHTYRVTPLSLWNAAALDVSLAEIISGMEHFSRYDLRRPCRYQRMAWSIRQAHPGKGI